MIEMAFGGVRTREQIKNKFKKMEKEHHLKVNALLENKEDLKLTDFEKKYGKLSSD